MQKLVATSLASLMFAGTLINPTVADAQSGTTTPIKHLVVIFGENESFDHYFGTYPTAVNPPGQPRFRPLPGTPDGKRSTPPAPSDQQSQSSQPGKRPLAPPIRFRLNRDQALTSSQNHSYAPEEAVV